MRQKSAQYNLGILIQYAVKEIRRIITFHALGKSTRYWHFHLSLYRQQNLIYNWTYTRNWNTEHRNQNLPDDTPYHT